MIKIIESKLTLLFYFLCIFVITLLLQAIILTFFSIFTLSFVLSSAIISLILSGILVYFFIRKDIDYFPRMSWPLLIVLIVVSFILISYPHDNFGGTDNGTYINLAFYLSKHGSIDTPSHLNGEPHIKSIKNILPAYPVFLSVEKILFGTPLAIRGNVILVILGLCSLFTVASILGNRKIGLITIILFSTSMPFLWFSRETLNENLAFFLVWFSLVLLLIFLKTKRSVYLAILLLCGVLFSFTRGEGFFIQFTQLFVIFIASFITKIASIRKIFIVLFLFLLMIFSIFLIQKLSTQNSYYLAGIENLSRDIYNNLTYSQHRRINNVPYLIEKMPFFAAEMLIKYNYFLVIFSIFLIIPYLIANKDIPKSKKFGLAILIFVLSMEFFKLINPSIQLIQPWMFRRYYYALLPLGYLCLVFFLNISLKRRLFAIVLACFLVINIMLSSKIIFLKHNWFLYPVLENITSDISGEDIIIIEPERLLGYYSLPYYFVMQKSIRGIHTFNFKISELSLNKKTYKKVPYTRLFFLTDKKDAVYEQFKLLKIKETSVNFLQLKPSCALGDLAASLYITDLDILPYPAALNYCKDTQNEIIEYNKKLYLYEVI